MENEKNKRAGIGQKPRGRQQTRGIEALPSEKPVASNEGQEEGVKDPVSETADRVQEGGGLLEEISTISDKTAENEKMPSVAVSEGQSLDEMLAQSKQENPVMGGLRRATPEEEEAFKQQKFGGYDIRLDESRSVLQVFNSQLGEQADGSFKVAVRLEEGYLEPVRQWAESEGITVEEWCSRQLSHYLETWGQPAKSR